jgi:hypothetical protein
MTAKAFTESITVYVKSLGPLASAVLAKTGHQVENKTVTEQMSRKGIRPGVEEAVDGRRGVPFEAVKPDGMIYIGFDYRSEIVAVAFEELQARSPVDSGAYRASHFAMLDGRGLGPLEIPSAASLAKVSRLTISNPLPYARKLEVGITESGKPFTADPHIFESAMIQLRRAYGAVAKFGFTFINLEGSYTLKFDQLSRHLLNGRVVIDKGKIRPDRVAGHAITYPAITIDRA